MLFQDVVTFLPFSNFCKISSKMLKVHSERIIFPQGAVVGKLVSLTLDIVNERDDLETHCNCNT